MKSICKPWDSLPDESPRAYNAFLVYRDLGPQRSLNKTWRHQKGNEWVTAPGRVRFWSTTFRWVERALAWDQHLRGKREAASRDVDRRLAIERATRELEAFSAKANLADSLIALAHSEVNSEILNIKRVVDTFRALRVAESFTRGES